METIKDDKEIVTPSVATKTDDTVTDVNTSTSSIDKGQSPEKVADNVETLDSVITEAAKAAEGEAIKDSKTADEPIKEEVVKEDTTASQVDDQPPFHEHPRWKEVLAQRDEARRVLDESKPLVEQAQAIEAYRRQHNINDAQMKDALELLALINSDPKKGVERLRQTLTAFEVQAGERLAPDLADLVEKGVIDEESAKSWMKERFEKETLRLQQEQGQRAAYDNTRLNMIKSLNEWEASCMKNDPDFKPKGDEKLPDGMFERVSDKFNLAALRSPPKTGAAAVALAEQAYQAVKREYAQFSRGKPVIRRSPGTTSSSNIVNEPQTLEEVIRRAATEASPER